MGICLKRSEFAGTIESGSYQLGAEAFHIEGIASVEFKAEDGSNPAVTSTVTTESDYDKRASVDIFGVWNFSTSLDLTSLDDGWVTITITATANDSTTKVDTYQISNVSAGTFTRLYYYVDYVNGDDDNGDGSSGDPYKTSTKVLELYKGGDIGLHVIYLMAGHHPGDAGLQSGPYPESTRGPLTITSAPGESKDTVSIGTHYLRNVHHIYLTDIHINQGTVNPQPLDGQSAETLVAENIKVTGSGTGWSEGDPRNNQKFLNTGQSDYIAVGEVYITTYPNAFLNMDHVRNAEATQIGGDMFQNTLCAVNVKAYDLPLGHSSFHKDFFQLTNGAKTNALFKSVQCYDADYPQSMLHDATGGGPYTDVWYVNCLFVSNHRVPFSQWAEDHVGVVMLWVTLEGQQINLRGDKGFTASGVRWINCQIDEAKGPGDKINTAAKFLTQGCHYRKTPNPGQYITGGVGDPRFTSPGSPNWDYRPKDGSPLLENGVAFFNAGPGGDKGVGNKGKPNTGAWGTTAQKGGGNGGATYEDPVPVEPTEWLHQGTDLQALLSEVFSDNTESLEEGVAFFSQWPSKPHASAQWATHYSIRVGARKPKDGSNWTVYLFATYGSPNDKSWGDRNRPYYSRETITVSLGSTNVNLDVVSSAEVIGSGQGVPPTVITWNPSTDAVVSTDFAGKDYAFVQSTRIRANPNGTGFSDDGEFVLRYNHADPGNGNYNDEGRDEFYPVASRGCGWVAANGRFVRGDVPVDNTGGFCCGEEGHYVHPNGGKNSTVYPITHIGRQPWMDKDTWDNSWFHIPRNTRATSGISAFCGNIISRHSAATPDEILRDFGYAWLLKRMAATQLQMIPSPVKPPISNRSLYNYESDAMRGKGRIVSVLTWLYRALDYLTDIREKTLDPEVWELRDACQIRAAEIVALLKDDYDKGSWLEYDREGGTAYAPWELGHYFQELLLVQEAIEDINGGTPDPKVHEMLETFAKSLYDVHVEWTPSGAHPYDATKTYTGSKTGWHIPYYYYRDAVDRHKSEPTDSSSLSSATTIMAHQWSKVNGINLGAKQDAIIAQDDSIDYKWQLGDTTASKKLYASATGTITVTGEADATITEYASATGTINIVGSGLPTITGGGKIQDGTPIAVTSYSVAPDTITITQP